MSPAAATRSAMYTGTVMHARLSGPRNRFRYPVCMYALDLDEVPELGRRLRLFGERAPKPLTLRAADHVGDPDRPIRENVEEALRAHGVGTPAGRMVLVTNLRVLGYVFNPISCVWVWDRAGELLALVAEVSNTFGERHLYVLPAADAVPRGRYLSWERGKAMHVSPFFGMDQRYRFVAAPPAERLFLEVSVWQDGARVLHATLEGRRRPLTDRALAWAQLRHPLMPVRVVALIHLQALRLHRMGARFHRKPRFRAGEGSMTTAVRDEATAAGTSAAPARQGLRPPPPAGRSPFTPLIRALGMGLVLTRPTVGSLTTRLPDGTVRRADSGRPGPAPTVTVHSKDLWRRFARRGMTGVGESYVAGDWDADDLPGAMEILLRRSEASRADAVGRLATAVRDRRPRLPERVSMALAGRHIRYHYDLGNDLYRLFLDDTMTYSCAVFSEPGETLEDAQRTKHRMICDKLRLRPGDRLLEIGCGWGAFAMVAAGEYGVHVTGVTLSHEQHALATERIAAAGLSDRIDIRLQDYRTLEGRWDAIASTEMIEAIGHRELPTFFRTCDRLLADDGLACIQAIAVPDQRYDRYRRSRDWITEYIFPGATVPSMRAMLEAMTDASDLMVHGVEDIGIHYAETLRRWRVRFEERRAEVLALGFDEGFIRAWRFYLAGCEAAFRARSIHDYQLVLTRPFNGRLPGEVR
ncbi:MAG: DUF1365 family protein [Thermoleophilia bacterium]